MAGNAPGASIRSVAQGAGVSVATVSNVLNGKSSVGPEIARRVLAAVAMQGYVRDSRASRLRSGKSRLVGVVVPDLTNAMFATFVATLETLARNAGFDLVVVTSRNDPGEEAARLAALREWRPAGLIVIPCNGESSARLPEAGPPLVVVDRIPDAGAHDLVAVDNAAATCALTRHLRAQGFRRCLVVGTSLGISNIRERWAGAQEGGAGGGMALDLIEVGFEDHAPAALADRLRGRPRPDALLCLDHETTLAAYLLLGELGLSAGADIGVASFDEMEWMRLVTPGITAVRQPVEAMADCAWSQLAHRLAGDLAAPQMRRLRCTLAIRGSTAARFTDAKINETGRTTT